VAENAAPLAAGSSKRDCAKPAVANSASQSPNEASPRTVHRRLNGRIRSTVWMSARVFAMLLLESQRPHRVDYETSRPGAALRPGAVG
jgi:hypothetical protein